MEKTVKITKSQLRRIIKEQSGDVPYRPVGGLRAAEPEDTMNLNAMLAELRKEGATDREIVDFMIGTRMVGEYALEAMQDFKKYEMKKKKTKPSVAPTPLTADEIAAIYRDMEAGR